MDSDIATVGTGCRNFARLTHMGRISHPDFRDGRLPVAPSAVRPAGHVRTPAGLQPFVTPRYLKSAEIASVIEAYRRSARLAVDSGFDGVEIDAADGCLPHQFLATNANLRTDDWGGSVRNRARFLLAVAAAAGAAIGRSRVGIRISPGHRLNDIDEQGAEETYAYLAERLDAMRLAHLHVLDVQPGWDVPALIREHHRGPVVLEALEPAARAA
jgi:N-ethylmaleimide reductase